jgi:hypothetical protein
MGFGVKPPPLVEISLDYISSTIVADAPLPFFSRGWLHAAPCSRSRRPSCTANSQRLPLLRPLKRHKWPRGGRALMVHGIGAGGGQSQPSLLEEDEDGWPAAPHRLRVGAWSLFLRANAREGGAIDLPATVGEGLVVRGSSVGLGGMPLLLKPMRL